jgi:glutaredoxin 3
MLAKARYGCALRLDQVPFGVLLGHARKTLSLLMMKDRKSMAHVKMYTTQVCPYCIRAKMLLKQRGVDTIEEIRIDVNPTERQAMMQITGRRTVPQIFIGNTHVGGCDDLIDLDQRGGLMSLLQA